MDDLQFLPTDPKELMRVVAAAFAVGDLRPLTAVVHKNIVWKTAVACLALSLRGRA